MVNRKSGSGFDPRFDPRFQPGYKSATDGLPEHAERRAPDDRLELEYQKGPAEQRETFDLRSAADLPANSPHPAEEHTEAEAAGPTVESAEPAAEWDAAPEANPNPFERVLWIVAAVMIVGGVWVAVWANSLNYLGYSPQWSLLQFLQSAAWVLSGPMVTVGLATAVGLLFRRAINWKPMA